MPVNMNDVKKLRNKTGAGFADCKKALEKSEGDFAEAEKVLKEMGLAVAAKRGGRQTGEGSIFAGANDAFAAMVELRCETDFVARNEDFIALGNSLVAKVLVNGSSEITAEMKDAVTDLIATIKENMEIKQIELVKKEENQIVAYYVHGKPGRLGAIVAIKVDDASKLSNESVRVCANSLALHAVARTPLYASPEKVDEAYKNSQIEIFKTQVISMGKPENIAAEIVQGKWNKHLDEVCFLLQPWVHDEKTTPAQELERVGTEAGTKISLSYYRIFVLGDE